MLDRNYYCPINKVGQISSFFSILFFGHDDSGFIKIGILLSSTSRAQIIGKIGRGIDKTLSHALA